MNKKNVKVAITLCATLLFATVADFDVMAAEVSTELVETATQMEKEIENTNLIDTIGVLELVDQPLNLQDHLLPENMIDIKYSAYSVKDIYKQYIALGDDGSNFELLLNKSNMLKEKSINENKCKFPYTHDDVVLLAKTMSNEARGEGYDGMVAVAEAIVNRVNCPAFPNTIYGVVYQGGQFSGNWMIADRVPTQEMLDIAANVLAGTESHFYNPDIIYFRNCGGYKGDWYGKWIGSVNHHEFYENYLTYTPVTI